MPRVLRFEAFTFSIRPGRFISGQPQFAPLVHQSRLLFQQRSLLYSTPGRTPSSNHASRAPFSPVQALTTSRSSWRQNRQLKQAESRTYRGRITSTDNPRVGLEPGADLAGTGATLATPGEHSGRNIDVKIVDYSNEDISQHEIFSTQSLTKFLQTQPKPDWAACRWIYVNGVDPNVLRCLGAHKGLHQLAIEDVLDTSTPTKVDWYDTHCFMEMTLQKLVYLHDHSIHGEPANQSSSDAKEPALLELMERRRNWRTLSHREFGVSVEQVSAFLTSDNTVITIFERSGQDVLIPVLKRLQLSQTILRSSNDPSMLIQAVIDAVVDLSLPIGKAVSEAFSRLEFSVLTNPSIEQSKQLYLLRSGLTLLMDNINAADGLIRTLIDHRAMQLPTANSHSPAPLNNPIPSSARPTGVTISPLAQIYLQDVHDHVRTLSASTHMSIRTAENLTSLIFNTIAASQNESVRQLTLVSCFFLPLTFLTGYFGMNFDPMPVVNENSDFVFWMIATPVMTLTIGLMVARARWLRSFKWFHRKRQMKSD